MEDNNGGLNIKVKPPITNVDGYIGLDCWKPIVLSGKKLGLQYDSSLTRNREGKLCLQYANDCPIVTLEEGIQLQTDSTLHVDDNWELGVNIKYTEPLDYDQHGLKLNLDDTLLVSENEADPQRFELGVAINHTGPITADSQGIDLEYDQKSLFVTSTNNPALAVKLKSAGALASDRGGIYVNFDDATMQISNGKLAVKSAAFDFTTDNQSINFNDRKISAKLKNNGGISKDNDGMYVSVDGSTITIQQGKLVANTSTSTIAINNTLKYDTGNKLGVNLKEGGVIVSDSSGVRLLYNNDFKEDQSNGLALQVPIKYLSPYVIYESGTFNLSTYDSIVRTSRQNWPCAYYAYAANSSGIVNMTLQIAIRREDVIQIQGDGNKILFTFVVNPGGHFGGDHSHMKRVKYTPSNDITKQYFAPTLQDSVYKKSIPAAGASWYVPFAANPGLYGDFMPVNRNLKPVWTEGRFKYFIGNVGSTPYDSDYAICITFDCTAADDTWYKDRECLFYSGIIPITYNARKPEYTSVNE